MVHVSQTIYISPAQRFRMQIKEKPKEIYRHGSISLSHEGELNIHSNDQWEVDQTNFQSGHLRSQLCFSSSN